MRARLCRPVGLGLAACGSGDSQPAAQQPEIAVRSHEQDALHKLDT